MPDEFRPPVLQGDGRDAVEARQRLAGDGSPHHAVLQGGGGGAVGGAARRDGSPHLAVAQERDPPAAKMAALHTVATSAALKAEKVAEPDECVEIAFGLDDWGELPVIDKCPAK